MRFSMVISTGVVIGLASFPALSQQLDRISRPPVSTSVPGAPLSNDAGGILPPLRPSISEGVTSSEPLEAAPVPAPSMLVEPPPSAQSEDQPPAADPVPDTVIPDGQIAFVRSFIVALNHANMTGNYSVLRDLGTQEFRRAASEEYLVEVYRPFREEKIDLSATLVIMPELKGGATTLADGSVRLKGSFPTTPLVIMFDITARRIDGRWQASAIAVSAVPHGG